MTTQHDERAGQVPLYEQLASVPKESRLVIDEGPHSTRFIPVGRMCHEAAAALLEADAKGGEAVAWIDSRDLEALSSYSTQCQVVLHRFPKKTGVALYTRTQQAAQVPLTDEQAEQLRKQWMYGEDFRLGPFMAGLRAGEAAHGIGKDQG